MNEVVFTDQAPAPIGPYSQAIRAGSTLYCAGQVPLDPKIGQLVSGSIVDQTRRALDNLFAVLGADQLSADNVVKTTVFLVDMADFPAMNEVRCVVLSTPSASANDGPSFSFAARSADQDRCDRRRQMDLWRK